MDILAATSGKGGPGKSTLVSALAGALVEHGRPVVAIDLDDNAVLTIELGVRPSTALAAALQSDDPSAAEVPLKVVESAPGLHVVPGGPSLETVDGALAAAGGRLLLRKLIAGLDLPDETVVLLDAPGSLGPRTTAAMCAADHILVPVRCGALGDLASPHRTINHRDRIDEETRGVATLLGVVPTQLDGRNNTSPTVHHRLQETYGDLLTPPLRQRIDHDDVTHLGAPVVQARPRSDAAADSRAIATWVLDRMGV